MDKFQSDFFRFLNFLKRKENFAFVRFSDGEAIVMQNKKLILASEQVQVGQQILNFGYPPEDHKEFDPEEHGFVREKLIESFSFKKHNYFVGGICPNCDCASKEYRGWMADLYGPNDEFYVSTNLLVNANYPNFIMHFVPEFKKRDVIIVCSEKSEIDKLPFTIKKDFRVGDNCIVNDHHLIGEMKEYISKHQVEDCIFLFSASSLSEILIYELYKEFDSNTYIDIGTTLNPYMNISAERDYLRAYWGGAPLLDLFKSCG